VEELQTLIDIIRDIHVPPHVVFGAGALGFLLGILSLHLFSRIASRLGRSYWLYFIISLVPVVNLVFFLGLADMPWWYVLGFIFPPLGLVIFAAAWGRIARALGKDFWLYAIGMCIPVLNVGLFIMLAY